MEASHSKIMATLMKRTIVEIEDDSIISEDRVPVNPLHIYVTENNFSLSKTFHTLHPKNSPFFQTTESMSDATARRHHLFMKRTQMACSTTDIKDYDPKSLELVNEIDGLRILGKDLHRLQRTDQMLCDNIINGYGFVLERKMEHLYNSNPQINQKIKIFNTFFYSCLTNNGYDYNNVNRYFKKHGKCDIFAHDVLLIPINVENIHWTLVAVYIKKRCIYSFDSLNWEGSTCLMNVLKWLFQHNLDVHNGQRLEVEKWRLYDHAIIDSPQVGGIDCGVYCLMFMDCLCHGVCLNWIRQDEQSLMLFRQYVLRCLIGGVLLA